MGHFEKLVLKNFPLEITGIFKKKFLDGWHLMLLANDLFVYMIILKTLFSSIKISL